MPGVQYLYVAQEKGKANQYKVGRTSRSPLQRRGELRGQADTDFVLEVAIETRNAKLAEQIAHSLLDQEGCRKATRRELFRDELGKVADLCRRAARTADSESAHRVQETTRAPAASKLTSRDPFWKIMLAMPVRFQNATCSLGELMALSLVNRHAQSRLAKLGVTCSAWHRARPQFEFDLHAQSDLATWARARTLDAAPEPGRYTVVFNRIES